MVIIIVFVIIYNHLHIFFILHVHVASALDYVTPSRFYFHLSPIGYCINGLKVKVSVLPRYAVVYEIVRMLVIKYTHFNVTCLDTHFNVTCLEQGLVQVSGRKICHTPCE